MPTRHVPPLPLARQLGFLTAWLLLAFTACSHPRESSNTFGTASPDIVRPAPEVLSSGDDANAVDATSNDTVSSTQDLPSEAGPVADVAPIPEGPPAAMRVGTWNLRNFSEWGAEERRLPEIASKIASLDADVLAVQELHLLGQSATTEIEAWDALINTLPDYEGVRAAWNAPDTTVGLLYRSENTTVLSSKTIFQSDWSFPRPPLVAELEVKGAGERVSRFHVVVLHLKAYGDAESIGRRREALTKLADYLQDQDSDRWIILGDLNDSPHVDDDENIFLDTFQGHEPNYYFVTAGMPLGTVTSTGWYHYVDGEKRDGEFLDHLIVTGGLYDRYKTLSAQVVSVPAEDFDSWRDSHSDHFPVLVDFTP